MALSQSFASELLEAFRAGEGVDLIRESVRLVMQDLIEAEASEQIGASRYELAAKELVRLAREQGLTLTGPNGLLQFGDFNYTSLLGSTPAAAGSLGTASSVVITGPLSLIFQGSLSGRKHPLSKSPQR